MNYKVISPIGESVGGPMAVGTVLNGDNYSKRRLRLWESLGLITYTNEPVQEVESEPEPEEKEAPQVVSKFAMDPDGIRGKSYEELMVMIAERTDEEVELETAEEAIEFLSQDFEAPEIE